MAKLLTLMLTTAAVTAVFFQMSCAQNTVTCYVCSSALNGDNCGESSFKKDNIPTCSGYQCFKMVGSVTGAGTTTKVTSRGCSAVYDDSNNNKCSSGSGGISGIATASETTCYCNKDNCNAATGIYPGRATGLLTMTAALILAYISRRLL